MEDINKRKLSVRSRSRNNLNIKRYRDKSNVRNSLDAYELRLRKKRKRTSNIFVVFVVLISIIVSIGIVIFIVKFVTNQMVKREEKGFSVEQMKNDIYIDYSLIGMKEPLSIRGKTRQDVYDLVLDSYDFDITITNSNPEIDRFELPNIEEENKEVNYDEYMNENFVDDKGTSQEINVENPYKDINIEVTKNTYKLPDFIEEELKKQIDDIYKNYLYSSSSSFKKKITDIHDPNFKSDFVFTINENNEYLDDVLTQLSTMWNTKASKGQIETFDHNRNEFVFGDDHYGYEIDIDGLRAKILSYVNQGVLKVTIPTILRSISPEGASIKSQYMYISSFETITSDNEVRNNNVDLAARAINGTIVKPNEEFSFNMTVGKRTEEKGYGLAQAYNQGEVVEELGGGVCQVSTTLYNAVTQAGLTSTYRRSHTFEPNYVTPGLDATVSYPGVDYKFINDSDYAIGIKASYKDRKMKVEIFSVPILKPGETIVLESKKIQELDPPSLSIIESGTATKGTKGSEWQVFKVVKNYDVEVDRKTDHYARYVGHTPTAFEENTYVDKDGILQTRYFKATSNVKRTISEEEVGEQNE